MGAGPWPPAASASASAVAAATSARCENAGGKLPTKRAPAEQLCAAGVPAWVVHTRKGDGGLTDEERRTLEACPQVRVLTLPGNALFLPDERAREVAGIVAEALGSAA